MSSRVQVYDLFPDDLLQFPVWEYCRGEEGAPDQDECTVRPVSRRIRVDRPSFEYLVRARFTLADEREYLGLVTLSRSTNAKIQALKKRACGYRNRDRFRHAILFHCGKLDLHPRLATHTVS